MFAFVWLVPVMGQPNMTSQAAVMAKYDLNGFDEESLPQELAGWQRKGFRSERREAGDINGELSATWNYERNGREAAITLDFPFPEWHPLTVCYRGRGCQLLDWSREPAAPAKPEVAVASLEMDNGYLGTLLFAEWDEKGRVLEPPITEGPSLTRLTADLKRRMGQDRSESPAVVVFQLQALSCQRSRAATTFPPEEVDALRQLFAGAMQVLRARTSLEGGAAP
jgi:hypothetical protein